MLIANDIYPTHASPSIILIYLFFVIPPSKAGSRSLCCYAETKASVYTFSSPPTQLHVFCRMLVKFPIRYINLWPDAGNLITNHVDMRNFSTLSGNKVKCDCGWFQIVASPYLSVLLKLVPEPAVTVACQSGTGTGRYCRLANRPHLTHIAAKHL